MKGGDKIGLGDELLTNFDTKPIELEESCMEVLSDLGKKLELWLWTHVWG